MAENPPAHAPGVLELHRRDVVAGVLDGGDAGVDLLLRDVAQVEFLGALDRSLVLVVRLQARAIVTRRKGVRIVVLVLGGAERVEPRLAQARLCDGSNRRKRHEAHRKPRPNERPHKLPSHTSTLPLGQACLPHDTDPSSPVIPSGAAVPHPSSRAERPQGAESRDLPASCNEMLRLRCPAPPLSMTDGCGHHFLRRTTTTAAATRAKPATASTAGST